MPDLLKLESVNDTKPPGITYMDAGNLSRRLNALCAPGTKVFMPGYVGTYQELEHTIAQHFAALKAANDEHFADGTPMNNPATIIYNQDNCFTPLLQSYGIYGDSGTAKKLQEKYNITIVNDYDSLARTAEMRATEWKTPRSSPGRKSLSQDLDEQSERQLR